ncbi:MAG TPA: cytochrome c oxidase assembly protein [Solirubrobacteraceae bacterium]
MGPDIAWTWSPGVLAVLALAAFVYVRRWRAARAEVGRAAASGWRLASFLAGAAAMFVALISPVDRLGEQLFLMHMVQHILILDVAAILLTLSLTRVLLRPVTRRVQRLERAAGPLGHPAFAVLLYAGGMILWHIPAAYDGALRHQLVHGLEHITFAVGGLLYWWHLLSPIRSRHRLGGLGPVAYMVTTKVLVGLLGIVLTFSPEALYAFYEHRPRYWGLSAVSDQNVGGALMALEQSIVMGTALVILFMRQLSESERDEQRAEKYA